MMREKIKMRKIDDLPARQVTFSKRRRGDLKKAGELWILCESEAVVVIFSQTGKLFDFSSSRLPSSDGTSKCLMEDEKEDENREWEEDEKFHTAKKVFKIEKRVLDGEEADELKSRRKNWVEFARKMSVSEDEVVS